MISLIQKSGHSSSGKHGIVYKRTFKIDSKQAEPMFGYTGFPSDCVTIGATVKSAVALRSRRLMARF